MPSPDLQQALNGQLQQEFYSAYLYLAMAAYCESIKRFGFGHRMRLYAGQESEQAMRFYNHIISQGGRVTLQALPQPPADFGSLVHVFEQALAHAQEITSLIKDLYQRASAAQDHASQVFLQDCITEQVKKEDNVSQILKAIREAGEDEWALGQLDEGLAGRSVSSSR